MERNGNLSVGLTQKQCSGMSIHTKHPFFHKLESYVHRFGAGLILHWFGHAPLEHLGNSQGEIVIASCDLPDSFMWPNGEITKG